MRITGVSLANWRNFKNLDVRIGPRLVVVGANATGKSNFLDAFRFMRDVAARDGGGLASAVKRRGGFGKVRCLFARRNNLGQVKLEFDLVDGADEWRYTLQLIPEGQGPSAAGRAGDRPTGRGDPPRSLRRECRRSGTADANRA